LFIAYRYRAGGGFAADCAQSARISTIGGLRPVACSLLLLLLLMLLLLLS